MNTRSIFGGVFFLVLGLAASLPAQEAAAPLKVVFLGDSITEAGVGPTGYVTLIADALKQRHRNTAIEVIGAGISGNKVPDLQARLEKDVLSHKPNLVVIYIGINDVWHSLSGKGTSIEQFESGLADLISRIHVAGSKVILCTPSVIGESRSGSNDLDAKLDEYSAVSRKLAPKHGVVLLDLRQKFIDELQNRNPDDKPNGVLTTDGVHLNDAGNQFVKDCMLPLVESVVLARPLRHVVMVKFKSTATVAEVNGVCDAFVQLPKKIDSIVGFENGLNVSAENLNQGYTHCFVLTFQDIAARDAYLIHPSHEEFKSLALPFVESVLVFDFASQSEN